MKSDHCIVVPIYKEWGDLEANEISALKALYSVLVDHAICLIGPAYTNWDAYKEQACEYSIVLQIKVFDSGYFNDTDGYNKLLLSEEFYRSFIIYKHILVYQTDAYIFRDELATWCHAGYDYIGAPWFDSWRKCDPAAKIVGVGNGGFSLRNVSKALSILKRVKQLRQLNKFWLRFSLSKLISFNKLVLRFNRYFKVRSLWELPIILGEMNDNEDIFWGMQVPKVFTGYNVAPVEEAIRFSFEVNPRELYELNGRQLPFGCHAWQQFDPEFWKPFIAGKPAPVQDT